MHLTCFLGGFLGKTSLYVVSCLFYEYSMNRFYNYRVSQLVSTTSSHLMDSDMVNAPTDGSNGACEDQIMASRHL